MGWRRIRWPSEIEGGKGSKGVGNDYFGCGDISGKQNVRGKYA